MTPFLSIPLENAVAAGWQCRFNKCLRRAVGRGTNRLEPQTQCLIMVADDLAQRVPPSMWQVPQVAIPRAMPIRYVSRLPLPPAVRRCVRARARLHDHCDLISAQIDGQTTVINPGRRPAARPPGVQRAGLSETSLC